MHLLANIFLKQLVYFSKLPIKHFKNKESLNKLQKCK